MPHRILVPGMQGPCEGHAEYLDHFWGILALATQDTCRDTSEAMQDTCTVLQQPCDKRYTCYAGFL